MTSQPQESPLFYQSRVLDRLWVGLRLLVVTVICPDVLCLYRYSDSFEADVGWKHLDSLFISLYLGLLGD